MGILGDEEDQAPPSSSAWKGLAVGRQAGVGLNLPAQGPAPGGGSGLPGSPEGLGLRPGAEASSGFLSPRMTWPV